MFQYEDTAKSEFSKLPTFMQWCKSASIPETRPLRFVKTIWLPGKFKNFTFETEVFRLRISESNGLFEVLQESMSELERIEAALAIEVLDTSNYKFRLKHIESETAIWQSLGPNGFKVTIQDKKGKSRAAKKLVVEDNGGPAL